MSFHDVHHVLLMQVACTTAVTHAQTGTRLNVYVYTSPTLCLLELSVVTD